MKLPQKSQMSSRTKEMLLKRKKGKSIVEIARLYNCSRQLVWSKLKKYGDPLDRK
jgi:DNA-binding CsgD family transcriptional regulator